MLSSGETGTFGSLLRRHRLAAGLTQAALAERSGIAERTIQDLERGAVRPRRATVSRLVGALALPPIAHSELEAVSSAPREGTCRTRVVRSESHSCRSGGESPRRQRWNVRSARS